MSERCLLVMARRGRRYIAGALNLLGGDCLYGRYWGAVEHHPCLHFEVCYYQAIDYAIEKGLARVEAGAQGEHKLARGYMPYDDLLLRTGSAIQACAGRWRATSRRSAAPSRRRAPRWPSCALPQGCRRQARLDCGA